MEMRTTCLSNRVHHVTALALASVCLVGCWPRMDIPQLEYEDAVYSCTVNDPIDDRVGRGALLLCDSLLLSNGCPLIESSLEMAIRNPSDWGWSPSSAMPGHRWLFNLKGPFLLSKQANSDTLIVVKAGRKYLFRLKVFEDYKGEAWRLGGRASGAGASVR